MLAIVTFMIFISVFVFIQGILALLRAPQERIDRRLQKLDETSEIYDHREDEIDPSLTNRLLKPALVSFGKVMFALSPKSKRDQLEIRLRQAGKTDTSAVGNWYLSKLIYALVLPMMIGLACVYAGRDIFSSLLYVALISLVVQMLLSILLKRRISHRQNEMRNALPDALDLITVSVEAGLSFDGAMDRVIKQMPNALSEEFAIALKEMRMGKTRREGLRALSERCSVDDITTLVGALIQADELGVSIGSVLRIQSEQMREKRRQRAREAAMKAPIKLLFPLMIFIFPTIFVILLGPAFIQMMDIF